MLSQSSEEQSGIHHEMPLTTDQLGSRVLSLNFKFQTLVIHLPPHPHPHPAMASFLFSLDLPFAFLLSP